VENNLRPPSVNVVVFYAYESDNDRQNDRIVTFRPFKVTKIIDFGTNRKRVGDFLLVRHSNFGPIFHRFRDIAGFCAHDPPLYSTLILDQIAQVALGQPEQKP